MSMMSKSPEHVVPPRPTTARRTAFAVAIGVGAGLFGAVVGLIVGANIGGNWMTDVSVAGQRGYEATGLIGAVVGSVVFGALGVWLTLRRRPR